MSNSLDSFLTRIGDVTIERVTPRGSPRTTDQSGAPSGTLSDGNTNDAEPQTANDESSEDSSGEMSEGEQEKKMESPRIDEIEEIHSEGSGDDMDLDETIDTQIGVRMESERQQSDSSSSQDDDIEAVNILDTLPLEGAPIEGQEVSEADLLGKPVSKEIEDAESIDNDNEKVESQSEEEEDGDGSKRHADSDSQDSTKKKQKKEDGNEGSSTECELKAEKKIANMRRNIREVMDETQLDEATLAAQRQEMERLRRVQEQQKIIREVQRQIAINRQNNKTQTRVISLLQGKQNQAGTTISSASPSSSQVRLPSTVLLKVNSGSGSSQSSSTMQTSQMQRRSIDAMRWQKGRGAYQGAQTSISRVPNRSTGPNMLQQRIRMMTPSVSISPVIPKKEPIDRSEYYSDSEISDIEADEALREKQLHTMRKMSSTQKVQKPMKGKDVVTISSSSESSDDDCIVLSDPSGGEETDTEDDPSNSGMHTNDRYNVPDEHGRVLINVGHPDTEPDVFLAPQVARIIKPHQIGGIRFLYDNIVESIERFKTSSGFGCILAHSMGLGKTLQVASFCDIFFRCTSAKTVLCIMPINTLQNWLAEFNMWLPYEDASSSKQDSGMNIKLDSSVESKQEIKEECGSQSDISNVSRPISTESVHRIGQDNISQPSNTENPFPHQGYETHSMVPNYMQESMLNKNGTDPNVHISQSYPSDISQSSMYSSNANSVSNFDPMKPEMDCHNISTGISATNCRLDNSGSGSAYSRMESQSQGPMYANMENRISSAPGSLYPGLDSQTSAPVYPGYENPSFTHTFSSYDPTQKLEQGIKQEPDQSTEINIKKEPEEAIKKEEGSCITPKEEMVEEKKGVEKVKTPFNVDTPIGMEVRPRHFRLHILNDSHKTMTARARVIHDWQKGGGVLLIGYELYRQLSLKKPNKAKRKRGQPFKDMVDVEEEDKNKGLLDEMHGALVNPGPDLVICDEGHRIKNSHASISLALKQMRTKRRIVLTGYPLQNNLLEYWCMVDFVRPNYLGTKSEFCNMFERPIQNGQCIDSTPQDIRLMRYRAHVLHALLEGFVQRRSHSVLQVSLPRKEEYILLVRMTAHQRKLYDTFMNQVVKTRAVPNPLKAFAVCCKIWNHPDILYHFLRKRQANEEDDLDLEETIGDKPTPGTKRSKARQPKGEPKKGKKTNNTTIKNKPAASVQPNSSSSSSNDNVESDNSKAGNYPNYTLPVTNSGYSNSVTQGSYPQGYQAYRSGDQNNFYRSEGTQGEYEFYNSQGQQQRYGNQSFQPYSQTPGYNPAQSYPSQPHNYLPSNNDQSAGHAQRYPPGPSSNDFRPDQTQGNNYDPTGIYPRQPYSYQDQGRSYTSSMNQGTNYSQVANQSQTYQNQLPNQPSNLPISDYPSYTTSAAQPQNYTPTGGQSNQIYPRTENQPGQNMPSAQNSTLAYSSNRQSQTPTPQTQPVGYLATQQSQNPPSQNQTRGFSPNQQNQQSQSLQNSTHAYSSTQQGQNVTLQQQNQSHGYASNQVQGQNPTSQTSALGYAPNQQTSNSVTQNPNRGYAPNQSGQASVVAHNQIRGYPSTPQSQNIAPQSQTTNIYSSHQQTSSSTSQNQTSHGYPVDQQGPISNSQNPIHGYPANHLVQTPTPQNQTPAFSPNPQSQTPAPLSQAHGYLTNQQGQTTVSQNTSHRYPANQQGQNSMSQSQTHGYSSIQPSQNSSLSQNSQIYSRSDNQTTQNYSATSNASRDYPVDRQGGNSVATPAANYTQSQQDQTQNPVLPTYPTETNHPNQVGQFKGPEDPYWQRNYSQSFRQDQCNDPYYRDSSVNRYQNNYFPSQNYSNQSYEYSTNHSSEVNSRSDESKIQSGTTSTHVSNQGTSAKSSKDTTATSTGAQSQSMPQDGLSTSTGYNNETELNRQNSVIPIPKPSQNTGTCHGNNSKLGQSDLMKEEEREKEDELDKDNKDKEDKSDDEILNKDEEKDSKYSPGVKEDPGIPYDWATELMKSYVPGLIDASAKMTLFFCILEEAVRIGDRVLAFSQSLFTLNLIEDFLARNSLKFPDGQTDAWVKNVNYYRLDGSTSALEREKLINEFNANPKIHLFLVSTRAGSLGINLVGANRAIVFDASWNPCHDTQAVCRVYRYGQQKPCFVYRLVTDNCLERKIYDRQISKQGMADRVVDQCNPDAHLSLKEATTLSWDWEEDGQVQDFSQSKDSYTDEVMHCVLERHSSLLTKQPFHHESLLVDRKDKKLSQAEKRLARRGYELEKMAANCSRPSYSYVPGNTATRAGGLQIRAIRGGDTGATSKPVASVRPMQQRGVEGLGNARGVGGSRWIPAEVWQRQGMSAQEMTLPLDVVIPTNSPDKGSIVLKAGQRVMVLKSPKGIYMQLESGKIIAIRTALKLNQQKREEEPKKGLSLMTQRNAKPEVSFPLRNNSAISIIPKSSSSTQGSGRPFSRPGGGLGYRPFADKEMAKRPKPVATAAAKPYLSQVNLTNQVSLSRLPRVKQEPVDHSSIGENSNSSDSQVRTEQRVEEVRLEDVVAEVSSNTDYGSSNLNRQSNVDSDSTLQKPSEDRTQVFSSDGIIDAENVQTRHDCQSESSEITPIAEKEHSQSENNETTKTDSLLDYDRSFENQKEKVDTSNDDIIIEEPLPPPVQQVQDVTKNLRDSSNSSAVSVSAGTNTRTTSPKGTESSVRESPEGDPHSVPQGYPYAQYPRYYDYVDPRSRSLSSPYGTYFPSIPLHSTSATSLPVDAAKPQSDVGKSTDRGTTTNTSGIYPNQTPGSTRGSVKTPENKTEPKSIETTTTMTTTTMTARDDTHVPTAFSHPTNTRYPGPYPSGPYDPYSQHYPPAPGSSAAYPPGGAPGYPAYGGPTYNSEYARMYSAFHGPPPAADPYMHRAYAPPTSHPPNYYPPFPHPPPPYPNYTFLPPYPNPNMPSEPQPPAQ